MSIDATETFARRHGPGSNAMRTRTHLMRRWTPRPAWSCRAVPTGRDASWSPGRKRTGSPHAGWATDATGPRFRPSSKAEALQALSRSSHSSASAHSPRVKSWALPSRPAPPLVRPTWERNRCCPWLPPEVRNGSRAPAALGNAGASGLQGPTSRVSRFAMARAGRPVNTLVSCVESSRASPGLRGAGDSFCSHGSSDRPYPSAPPKHPVRGPRGCLARR